VEFALINHGNRLNIWSCREYVHKVSEPSRLSQGELVGANTATHLATHTRRIYIPTRTITYRPKAVFFELLSDSAKGIEVAFIAFFNSTAAIVLQADGVCPFIDVQDTVHSRPH
jgi:hypothetical protein